MKKLARFVVYLMLSVLGLGVTTVVAAENSGFNIYINSGRYNDGNYTLIYEIVNNSPETFSGTIIFGAFDESERLISVKSIGTHLDGGEDVYKKVSLGGAVEDFSTLKVFVWDSLDTLEPRIPAIVMDFSSIPESVANEEYYFFEEPFTDMGKILETVTVGGIAFNKPDEGRELIVNPSGYVELGGAGNMTKCSLGFKVKGNCKINVWTRSRSSEEARVLKIGDAYSEFEYFDAPPNRINKCTYIYEGGEKDLYVASKAAAILVYAIEVIYDQVEEDAEEVYYANDFKTLKKAMWKAGANGGGTIVINADVINCSGAISLENAGTDTITICGGEGYKAILDFDEYRKTFNEDDMNMSAGITLRGSNYVIKDIIVQNAPGVAIRIQSGAGNNCLENIVSRYNGGNGFAVTDGAHDNTLKNCYSYRNCDIITKGENADGFWIAFSAGTGNKLIDCYSWENADDGFDSFNMFNDVYYENCFAWRNGTADVFLGKLDFERGRKLDENLRLVQKICEYDASFKEKYENGVFELPQGEFLLTTPIDEVNLSYISAADFVGKEWRGNGNGIKLGSGSSATTERPQVGPEAVRTMINCITFEHRSKGFDRNNANCTVYVQNGLSFDNDRNYWLDTCTIPQFENVYSSNTSRNLLPTGRNVTYLSDAKMTQAKNFIYDRVDVLEGYVYSDQIPHGVCFEQVFDILK